MEKGRSGGIGGIHVNNPFPGEPRGLRLVRGQLLFNAETVASEEFAAGRGFTVEWKAERGGRLSVFHRSQPHTAAWSTADGTSFISAALGDGEIVESRGSFAVHDQIQLLCRHQTVEQISSWWPEKEEEESTTRNPTTIASSSPSSSAASCCNYTAGIPAHNAMSMLFSPEQVLRSMPSVNCTDADGTLLSNEGSSVIVTGCLYNNAKLAREQLKLHQAAHRKRRGEEGEGGGRSPPGASSHQLNGPFYSNNPETESGSSSCMGGRFHRGSLPNVGVRYYLVFSERRDHHLGFHVWLDQPQALPEEAPRRISSPYQLLSYQRLALSADMSSLLEENHEELLQLLEEEEQEEQDSNCNLPPPRYEEEAAPAAPAEEERLGMNLEPRLQWLWSSEPASAFASARSSWTGLQQHMRKEKKKKRSGMKGYQLVQMRETKKLALRTTASYWWWWWWSSGGRIIPIVQQTTKSFFKRWKKTSGTLTSSSSSSSNIVALLREQRNVHIPQFNRIQITYSSHKGEKFYGFGEQFSHFDMKGRRVPILVQEQGLGRGDQPITAAANLVAHRAGGAWHTTYAPSPHYMTSDLHSMFLENYEYCVFDLTRHDRVQLQVHAGSVKGRILQGHTPAELIKHYTAATGHMQELPSWITKGAIVGMQGGSQAVRQVWEKLQDLDVPLSAFWLQDWVGQRKTSIGWQLWWNWEVDSQAYPDWEKLVQDLRAHGIRTMTYCNPFLVSTDEKPNRRWNMFDDAKNEGMVVGDNTGAPYMIPNTSFDAAMVDLTNPATRKWFKSILHNMVKTGVRGWMADFGESLPFDSCLYSGEDPATAHNKYPELWAELNREFLEEWEKEQHKVHHMQSSPMCTKSGENLSTDEENQDDEEQLVFFMRAGYRGSPRWSTLFWAGDQMVSWQRHDGIKSAVTGLLTSGLSGYAFNHSDIGGYCTVNLPFLKYRWSEELLLRWMELNAFSTIFRTHEGNIPAANSQFYSNERTFAHFARCAKMYQAWEFYRWQLVKEAAATGMPVVRHMFLHYPHDKHVQSIVYQQFLVGSDILVVPVLDKGRTKVHAYFPAGDIWKHLWTGILYSGGSATAGQKAWVQAPLGFPAVFVKAGSQVAVQFMANLVHQGVVNKKLSSTASSQQ